MKIILDKRLRDVYPRDIGQEQDTLLPKLERVHAIYDLCDLLVRRRCLVTREMHQHVFALGAERIEVSFDFPVRRNRETSLSQLLL